MHTSTFLMIEVIFKGTAIIFAGYGGAALLARSSAAHRSWWWLGVFAALLLLPLALLVRPLWTLPVHADVLPARLRPELPTAVSPPFGSLVQAPTMAAPITGTPVEKVAPVPRPPSRPVFHLGSWLFGGYAFGAVVVLGFRFLGSWHLGRLRRDSIADPEAQALIDRWRQSFRFRRGVQVYRDPRVTVPMTWGIWHPVILLPVASGAHAEGELQAALHHEFAHIRHHDAARRWLGTIVAALWWPHPLVWLAGRAWKLEQERACDDAVLIHGGDAASYAHQLLEAASRLRLSATQNEAALIMATPAGLETRLRSVIGKGVDRSPVRLGAALRIVTLTVMAVIGGIAFQARSVVAAPPEDRAAVTPAGATEPENSLKSEPSLQRFQAVYKLKDGEVLRYMPKPFIAERLAPLAKNGDLKRFYSEEAPDYVIYCQSDYSLPHGDYSPNSLRPERSGVSWEHQRTLADALHDVVGLMRYEQDECARRILQMPLEGDWTFRDGATPEALMAALQDILRRETKRKFQFQRRLVEQDVVVARGEMRGPAGVEHYFHIYSNDSGEDGLGGESGDLNRFLAHVGDELGLAVINEVPVEKQKPPGKDQDIWWAYHHDGKYWNMGPRRKELTNRALKNLADQTGLIFTRDKRTVPVWFLEEEK